MDEGRFPPGTLLAQRYRIVSLLGRGGMGEVYRANDLLLAQTVALKFLPAAATANESALSRFRNEVRTARQVSHPNVCRVYDIGEAEGLTYLTMEYVDGEDLASLLRRIGKLPQDKALEIARKLCAGLAAAHDKGVVHRDLKPANIMLDAQGQVRITDFGLAGFAVELRDVRSGTPAYMAPEQRAGKEVTPRSDIYSLGVVLHEVFTGKRPSPGTSTPELDPAVDRVLQRCLQEDPQKRPPTALAVAAALPGGDPLAAALAAGETPSPDTVANAGEVEGLRVPVAVACLAAIIVGLVALCFLRDTTALVNQLPLESAPDVLAAKAREIAKSLGYTERPADAASGWNYNWDYLGYARQQQDASARWMRLKSNRPPAIHFWRRESPSYLVPVEGGAVTRSDPPPLEAGMLEVLLDSEQRLVEFHARPPTVTQDTAPKPAPDWPRLFAAADLDLAGFTATQPIWTPPAACDARAAWTASYPGATGEPLRVEAAAYQGRPVFFKVAGPWSRPGAAPPELFRSGFLLLFTVALPVGAFLVAWRNARLGRGDRWGAFRLACFVFGCMLLLRLFQNNHVPVLAEGYILSTDLRHALATAAICGVLYIAFEPYVRRRSPHTLISWSRLLAGRLRDPLLGADVLVGVALGVAAVVLFTLSTMASPFSLDRPGVPPLAVSAGPSLSLCLFALLMALGGGLSYMFLLVLLRFLVRRGWLAALFFLALNFLIFQPPPGPAFPARAVLTMLVLGLSLYVLTRFGVLAVIVLNFVQILLRTFPLTTHLSAWYAQSALLAMASVLALAIYGFHTTLAGRPLWRDELREV
jgi:hypothetical protein